jgi:hypothetical protein
MQGGFRVAQRRCIEFERLPCPSSQHNRYNVLDRSDLVPRQERKHICLGEVISLFSDKTYFVHHQAPSATAR